MAWVAEAVTMEAMAVAVAEAQVAQVRDPLEQSPVSTQARNQRRSPSRELSKPNSCFW